MDGNIGCMVNGAGLAMATMDMIKIYGGNPANFLDIGGSSNPIKVVEAMKLLLQDEKVKVVLINIFGGITRCDDVAIGLIQSFEQIKSEIPIIVRLTGTNENIGRDLLRNHSRFQIATTMQEAALMAIKDKSTRLIVQGITGRDGLFHARKMKEYGTNVVGGTSPGKGGTDANGIPVFNTMYEAVEQTQANTSIIFVPARFAADAIMEAADAGIRLIVCIAEGIPTLDVIKAHQFIKQKGAILVGPNCPGLISPGKSMVGILPGQVFQKGNVGVISRSGTLTYEIVYHLTANGMGQSTAIGIGGDPVVGLHFRELLEMFQNDTETEAIVLIGEIGGNAEEQAAEYIRNHVTKPVVAFIAGQSAPLGKQMGHAGAIISGTSGSAKEKIEALEAAGIQVAQEPSDIPALLKAAKDTTRDILKLREQELVDLELELNNMVDDEENNNRD